LKEGEEELTVLDERRGEEGDVPVVPAPPLFYSVYSGYRRRKKEVLFVKSEVLSLLSMKSGLIFSVSGDN